MRPRLYVDEDVSPELARGLRRDGHDAISAHELGALGLPDEEHLARATADGRAILTFNYHDFLPLSEKWSFARRPHAGIIVSYRQYERDGLGRLSATVLKLLTRFSAEDLADTVQVLDNFRER